MTDPVHELVQELHAKFDEERARLHRKVDALVAVCHHLMLKVDPMSKAHDDLLALAKDTDTQADALIAAKSNGDSSLADIAAIVSGTRDKLVAAVKADTAPASTDQTTGAATATGAVMIDPATGLPVSG